MVDERIKKACAHYNFKWPKELTSGVMFYEGLRITIQQFNKWARNFR